MAETTRERLKALHAAEPSWTAAIIARELGVSRQRVHQLAEAEGLELPTYAYIPERPRRRTKAAPPEARVRTGGLTMPLSHVAAGVVGELLCAADLAARGWLPFLPAIRHRGVDLLALSRDSMKVERIEVRCGKRTADGKIVYNRPERSKSDRVAVVMTGEPVVYYPPYRGDTST
jgi:hypothetical protein